jgi:murein DD-endopeptidase MepM/ murein hydrolase activator NlpD
MKRVLVALLILAATNGLARADIYRLDNDDETISFTDSPNDKRFQLIMKESRARKPKAGATRSVFSRPARVSGETEPASSPATIAKALPLQGRITSQVGLRHDPFDGKLKHHNGLDIAAPSGTPVKPVAPGTVIFSGWKNGYGNTVILDHSDGMTTVYAHHASNDVTEGCLVEVDTVIAHSGSTGRSTGPHLHFEAWRNGINITEHFIPDSTAAPYTATIAAAPINRYLQADGTIVFTNLR